MSKAKNDIIHIRCAKELKDSTEFMCNILDIDFSDFVRNAVKEKISKEIKIMEKKLNKEQVDSILKNVKANFDIEGLVIEKNTEDLGRSYLEGQISFEEGMKTFITNYGDEK